MTPEVPFYSATAFDPREQPVCDAGYWADNLRHMVRFAAAVRAALEDGYRVFAELAPHPYSPTRSSRPPDSLGMPVAALAAMRREQELPHGLRGFLADLHSAGAAIDFSVIYPGGQLVDAPLPTWTHRPLLLDPQRSGFAGARRLHRSGAPAVGAACAIARGAGAPRLAGRGRHRGAALAGRPPDTQCRCSSRSGLLRDGVAAARTVLGENVRSPRHPFRGNAVAGQRDPDRRSRR